MSNPKAPFQQINGQQPSIQNHKYSSEQEIRKFIHDSWVKVCKEIEVPKNGKEQTVAFYTDMSGDQLPFPGFKPFDLNLFLEQRSVYHHNNRPVSQ